MTKYLTVLFLFFFTHRAASSASKFDNTTVNTSHDWKYLIESLERYKRFNIKLFFSIISMNFHFRSDHEGGNWRRNRKEHTCDDSPNKNLCLPKSYSKFELPFTESVNVVEIGIDIIDVLRINDKVSSFFI